MGFDSIGRMEELILDDVPSSQFISNKLRSEWVLASFLDSHGVEYGVYSDNDLAFDYSINNAEVIVLNTHSEYWSSQMIGRLQQFIEKGGKVVCLSGNNIYRQIEFSSGYIEVVNQGLDSKKTTELLGTFFTGTESEKEMGYMTVNPNHWVFKGTGMKLNSVFGKYSANWGGYINTGYSHGASADETDQINEFTKEFETLAIGENKNTPAYMVFKDTKYGGWVFNASSITFVGALFHDAVVNQIVLNLLKPVHTSVIYSE
jgi:N,N-dimethylformamidase